MITPSPLEPLQYRFFWYFLVVWDLYNKRFIQCFRPKRCPLVFWGMLFPGTVNFHIFAITSRLDTISVLMI